MTIEIGILYVAVILSRTKETEWRWLSPHRPHSLTVQGKARGNRPISTQRLAKVYPVSVNTTHLIIGLPGMCDDGMRKVCP